MNQQNLDPVQESLPWQAIAVDAIHLSRMPPMDLYIAGGGDFYAAGGSEGHQPSGGEAGLAAGGGAVLFHSRALPIDAGLLEELRSQGIETIWITGTDYARYEEALLQDFISVAGDPTVPIEAKCEITYDLSAQLMHHAFVAAEPVPVMQAAEPVVNMVIDVVFQDADAAHHFLMRTVPDYALYTHAVHVCMLGVALAKRALGISKEEALHRFGPGLLLHDLGLTEMPKDLYERYDPLNPILEPEFRRHPEVGLALVREFMDLTPESESIILHHHERLDGSGFPMGIAGDELSDGAKICAIVDTFDLLNTRTRYRERLPSFEALKAMKRGVPWQLDESFFHEFVRIFLPPS